MQKGAKGNDVELLQIMLNLCQPHREPLKIDGDFGNATERSLSNYSEAKGFGKATVLDSNLKAVLQADYTNRKKYVIAIDMGHGGLDPQTGLYTTPADNGKRYQHPNTPLHTKDGWFFEGVENRIIGFKLIFRLRKLGFLVIMANHEYLDWYGTSNNSDELERRGEVLEPYLKHGLIGTFHSIHSNAAPEWIKDKVTGKKIRKRTKKELDDITGSEIYTTEKETESDRVDNFFIEQIAKEFGKEWIRGGGEKKSNFAVISAAERTFEKYKVKGTAFLTEVGVYTSEPDCKKITSDSFRERLVECFVNAHVKTFEHLNKK